MRAVLRQVGFGTRDALRNLRRNRVATSASVLSVAVALFLTLAGLLAREAAMSASVELGGSVRFAALLKSDLEPNQPNEVLEMIGRLGGVEGTRSPTVDELQEMDELRARHGNHPNALLVVVDPVDDVPWDDIAVRVRDLPGVEGVQMLSSDASDVAAVLELAEALFPPIPAILGVAALLLIANTIRLAIWTRRDDIRTMRLVGAPNWYIRVPFVTEGMLLGLIGGLAAVAGGWILNMAVREMVTLGEEGASALDRVLVLWSAPATIAAALLGGLVSLISLRRASA